MKWLLLMTVFLAGCYQRTEPVCTGDTHAYGFLPYGFAVSKEQRAKHNDEENQRYLSERRDFYRQREGVALLELRREQAIAKRRRQKAKLLRDVEVTRRRQFMDDVKQAVKEAGCSCQGK